MMQRMYMDMMSGADENGQWAAQPSQQFVPRPPMRSGPTSGMQSMPWEQPMPSPYTSSETAAPVTQVKSQAPQQPNSGWMRAGPAQRSQPFTGFNGMGNMGGMMGGLLGGGGYGGFGRMGQRGNPMMGGGMGYGGGGSYGGFNLPMQFGGNPFGYGGGMGMGGGYGGGMGGYGGGFQMPWFMRGFY